MADSFDHAIRIAAFEWLNKQVDLNGEVLRRTLLLQGFSYQGERVSLLSPQQGIFKPRMMNLPLSITTTPNSPYDDAFDTNDLLRYRYRGTDPAHRDNRGLRQAMLHKIPLAYFHGVVPGKYLAVFPVYIIGDEPGELTFTVAADDLYFVDEVDQPNTVSEDHAARRQYITATVRRRLHQQGFRERVLRAYRNQCSLCKLRHPELLDAAHIIPDGDPEGQPIVQNGITLCKIHHAAYDRNVLGITPDYVVEIRSDILEEIDGPMLKHGLVEMNGNKLILPHSKNDWPDRDRLSRRYQLFTR